MTVYLDNAASTPVDPEVVEAMLPHLRGDGANPASVHGPGRAAASALERAREQTAAAIGARPEEIVWTAGATEANNLAVLGAAAYWQKPRHVVTVATEHKSILDPVRRLEAAGWRVTRLGVDAGGRVDPDAVAEALAEDTALVSVMHVNNETGVIQDLGAIGARVRAHGAAAFHVDAAQGAGKLPLDVNAIGADLMSLSAHKLHGPKGIGALYLRARPAARIAPILYGGGHERGFRPGTPAVHQAVGMGTALALACARRDEEQPRIARLRDRLWTRLSGLPGAIRNSDPLHVAPGILNVGFENVHGEALHAALAGGEPPLAVSSGSACASAGADSSYVLRALGRDRALAAASVRYSLGRFTTEEDIERAAEVTVREVRRLQAMAPDVPAAAEA